MMDERDQHMTARCRASFSWQRAERKAVDDERHLGWHSQQALARPRALVRAGLRETGTQIDHIDLPATRPQRLDQVPRIGIAAGRRCEIARNGKRDATYHKGAS